MSSELGVQSHWRIQRTGLGGGNFWPRAPNLPIFNFLRRFSPLCFTITVFCHFYVYFLYLFRRFGRAGQAKLCLWGGRALNAPWICQWTGLGALEKKGLKRPKWPTKCMKNSKITWNKIGKWDHFSIFQVTGHRVLQVPSRWNFCRRLPVYLGLIDRFLCSRFHDALYIWYPISYQIWYQIGYQILYPNNFLGYQNNFLKQLSLQNNALGTHDNGK